MFNFTFLPFMLSNMIIPLGGTVGCGHWPEDPIDS